MIARLSPQTGRLSTKIPYLLGIALLMAHIWWSVSGLFGLWPQNEEVQFVWQAALTDMAEYLDDSTETSAVAIGGWSPGTMDPPTMYLSMRRRDLPLRFFGSDSQSAPISTIILPGWGQAIASGALETAASLRLLRPAIRELGPAIEEQLRQWSDGPLTMDSFVRYAISQPELPAVSVTSDATFAEQLELIGYLPLNEATCGVDGCRILTYWHILAPTAEPRRFFLHLIGRNEQLLSQHDGLDVPVQQWQAGDLLVQEHWLPPVASGEEITALRLGVYDPQSGRRLRLPDGRDYLTLR